MLSVLWKSSSLSPGLRNTAEICPPRFLPLIFLLPALPLDTGAISFCFLPSCPALNSGMWHGSVCARVYACMKISHIHICPHKVYEDSCFKSCNWGACIHTNNMNAHACECFCVLHSNYWNLKTWTLDKHGLWLKIRDHVACTLCDQVFICRHPALSLSLCIFLYCFYFALFVTYLYYVTYLCNISYTFLASYFSLNQYHIKRNITW